MWTADITYLPTASGFLYLVVILDWRRQATTAWRLPNTLETDSCVNALQDALGQGRPEAFNTGQGSQFTTGEFTQFLQGHGVKISMDGKGRYADNIFAERPWRTVKSKELYLDLAPRPVKPGGNWAPISGSTTARDLISPWAPGLRPMCSTGQ